MQVGSFEVPEVRLYPHCLQDVKTIYEAIHSDGIASLDLAKTLGYTANTTSTFYRRLNSMLSFGLMERRGKYFVSELGKNITYPENDHARKVLMKKAVLSVPLWNEFFKKFGKNPPEENFWVQLKSVTGVESPIAQKHQNFVRKWYLEDTAQISDDLVSEEEPSKDLSSSNTIPAQGMAQELVAETAANAYGKLIAGGIGSIDITDEDTLSLARLALNILGKKILEAKAKASTNQTKEMREPALVTEDEAH